MSKKPDVDLVTFYDAINRSAGFSMPPHLFPIAKALEDERIDKLEVIIGPGAGKSQLISVTYPAWVLGTRPDMTIMGISAAGDLMAGFVSSVMKIVEFDPVFAALFPDVKPDKNSGWSSERGMNVTGKPTQLPDASYLGAGLSSSVIEGKHCKLMIIDDIHSHENSMNPAVCRAVIDRFYMTLMGRADPSGCRYIVAGRRWSVYDFYGHLESTGEWVTCVLPAERYGHKKLYWDVSVPAKAQNVFTEGLGKEVESDNPMVRKFRVYYGHDEDGFFWPGNTQKKKEYFSVKRANPYKAKSVYQCSPQENDSMVFRHEDIVFVTSVPELTPDTQVVSAWDTAATKGRESAYSAGVVAYLTPCKQWHKGSESIYGECDEHMDITIVDIIREKMEFEAIYESIRRSHQKWGTHKVLIEDRSSGSDLASILPNVGIPIEKVRVTQSKLARAVQSLPGAVASVQGWFQMGRVRILVGQPWTQPLVEELLSFDGSGVSDQVDALVHLVGYAIRMSSAPVIVKHVSQVSGENVSDVRRVGLSFPDHFSQLLGFVGVPPTDQASESFGYGQFCGSCRHFFRNFCGMHKRTTGFFMNCPDYDGKLDTSAF